MQMEKLNKIIALVVLVFTAIVYYSTAAPTVSFWDCGEFIACSYKMAVPHPPGAPLYLLVGRLFTMLPIAEDIALRVNIISVLSSAITIMLLYLSIVHIVRHKMLKLETKSDWYIAIFSGLIGSLTFAFTHSFWFNAVEAEVYAPSMLFTSLLVWLILVWETKADKPGNEKYLLMIAYLIGLAIAVHLLNVLALPFVAMIFYYKQVEMGRWEFNVKTFAIMTVVTAVIMIAVYPGMVKWMPLLALKLGAMGLAGFFIAVLALSMWAINNHRHILTLVFVSVLLIAIGYSTYATIYIRSNLNPMIDENNPETVENFIKYINREQYGDSDPLDRTGVWRNSPNAKNYRSVGEFFWKYQINKMYVRYFLWQFVGMSDDETNVDPKELFALPFLLGLFGMLWHFRRDPKYALAILALFFMTGLAIILYLNQPDPQPRERDYSYVGSFFAFSMWVGIGFAGIAELLKEKLLNKKKELSAGLLSGIFIVLLLAIPIHMLAKSYHHQDRSGNYVAWDYSYNMLMSCEPNAILFTNGDNDTFPLWYLQEVENIRTDVRIVNLSLLNTDWYIRQLRDLEPKVPMRVNEAMLERLGLHRWEKNKTVSVKVPKKIVEEARREYQENYLYRNLELPEQIRFKVEPTLNTPYGPAIRTQDYMILNIIAANRWRKPIYFAVTVPGSNMLTELASYLRMDGLVLRLVPYKNWRIAPDKLKHNLMNVYKYRGLDDPNVYFNRNILNLLQNYRSGFIQLAEYYMRKDDKDSAREMLAAMNERVRPDVIPWNSRYVKLANDAFTIALDSSKVDSILATSNNQRYLEELGRQLLGMRFPAASVPVLEKAYELNPGNPQALGMLINAYRILGQDEKAIAPLEDWIRLNPNDKNAKRMLDVLKKQASN